MNAPALMQRSDRADKNAHFFHPDYLRLFGPTPADQVISTAPPSRGQVEPDGSPSALCDPTQAASHPLYQILAAMGHPSALTLAAICALRARHMAKGHTLEADAAQGWVYFKRKSDDAYRDAIGARSPETRRLRLIIAAAILVAQIDAEAFLTQQQEPTP